MLWMRGSHDLLREKPSNLFIFLVWSSVFSLLWWYNPCICTSWAEYWCSASWCSGPGLWYVQPQQTYQDGRGGCAGDSLWLTLCLNWISSLSSIHLPYSHRMLHTRSVIGVILDWPRKLRDLSLREAHHLDVSWQYLAGVIEGGEGQKHHQTKIFSAWQWDSFKWIHGIENQFI